MVAEDGKKNTFEVFSAEFETIKRKEKKVKDSSPFDFASKSDENEFKARKYMKKILKHRS